MPGKQHQPSGQCQARHGNADRGQIELVGNLRVAQQEAFRAFVEFLVLAYVSDQRSRQRDRRQSQEIIGGNLPVHFSHQRLPLLHHADVVGFRNAQAA